MSTYAIGDIQGCFKALEKLLEKIHFNPTEDELWLTGDLVNRGPDSLAVLRYIKSLKNKQVVLGNHDLHCLAVAFGVQHLHSTDTLTALLAAPDKIELIDWLLKQPLLVHRDNYLMVHAGLAPAWTLATAQQYAREVETALRSQPQQFLQQMYGNQPDRWHDDLTGLARLRCITNYLTRLRFCYADGRMDFTYKGTLSNKPKELIPWYELNEMRPASLKIIFGHWAALNGKTTQKNIFPLDTGCVWGNCLTALRLEDQAYFHVSCLENTTKS